MSDDPLESQYSWCQSPGFPMADWRAAQMGNHSSRSPGDRPVRLPWTRSPSGEGTEESSPTHPHLEGLGSALIKFLAHLEDTGEDVCLPVHLPVSSEPGSAEQLPDAPACHCQMSCRSSGGPICRCRIKDTCVTPGLPSITSGVCSIIFSLYR